MRTENVIFVNELFRDENMKSTHSFKKGTLVRYLETDPNNDYESPKPLMNAFEQGMSMFIHECTRDCDGTPLYTLSTISTDKSIKDYIVHDVVGLDTFKHLNQIESGMLIIRIQENLIITGIPESCLKLAF